MEQIVSTEIDVQPVLDALSGTSKSIESIEKSVLRIAAKETAKCVRAAVVSSDLNVRTGELRKAYTYKVKKYGSSASVYPKALVGKDRTIFPKAMTLSYGHEGPTKRASNWYIKPRGFVQAGQRFADSGAYMDEVEKMVSKELDKYWS